LWTSVSGFAACLQQAIPNGSQMNDYQLRHNEPLFAGGYERKKTLKTMFTLQLDLKLGQSKILTFASF
jgi:hypothetical protein